MTPEQMVSLLGAGGLSAFLLALINGVIKWLSGSSARERRKNTNLVTQRQNAVHERDVADKKRRIIAEHASSLRQQLNEAGITPKPYPAKELDAVEKEEN